MRDPRAALLGGSRIQLTKKVFKSQPLLRVITQALSVLAEPGAAAGRNGRLLRSSGVVQNHSRSKSGLTRYLRNTRAFVRTPDTTCWYIGSSPRVFPKYALLCSKT